MSSLLEAVPASAAHVLTPCWDSTSGVTLYLNALRPCLVVRPALSAQVRKTDSKGADLPPGIVAVTGPKTALPPVQLVMGYGILFKVDVRNLER